MNEINENHFLDESKIISAVKHVYGAMEELHLTETEEQLVFQFIQKMKIKQKRTESYNSLMDKCMNDVKEKFGFSA